MSHIYGRPHQNEYPLERTPFEDTHGPHAEACSSDRIYHVDKYNNVAAHVTAIKHIPETSKENEN